MPRDLPVGNGQMLVNFDRDYNIRDIYYPYVGKANHSNGCISRTGVWVDGQFSWLGDTSWAKKMDYMPHTLATFVTATNEELALRLVFHDVVDFHRDVFLRRVEVVNLAQRVRNVRLFFHYDFKFWSVGLGDAIHYYPHQRALIAYKDDCYFLMNGAVEENVGISSWSTGHKDQQGKGGCWSDAEDGVLDEDVASFGSVDGVIAVHKPNLGPGDRSVFFSWLAAAKDLEGVRLLDFVLRRRGPQYFVTRTMNYWRAWLGKEDIGFHDLPETVVNQYTRSLLILRTQVDNRGGIIAANDSDLSEIAHGFETYSYIWPRDGAYVANALDKAGYAYLAVAFYNFCKDVIHYEPDKEGYHTSYQEEAHMLHKYTPDRLLAANWMPHASESHAAELPIQEDETAIVPFVLWQHYRKFRDIETIKPWFRPLIIHTANFMTNFREQRTRLPAPSFDLWEERRGITSYTASTVWAGLMAAADFAELFGELGDAQKFRRAAAEIKAATITHLYDEDKGRFLKRVSVGADGSLEPDHTVDASLYGLWYFGMFETGDPRIERTMQAVVDRLTCQTDIGGLARYEGDMYHWDPTLNVERDMVPGNPWFICTLWLAQYHIAKARSTEELAEAIPVFEWACARALPSGVMSEQVHPVTGEPMSVSPLTWSHSTFVAAVQEYISKYEALRREPRPE